MAPTVGIPSGIWFSTVAAVDAGELNDSTNKTSASSTYVEYFTEAGSTFNAGDRYVLFWRAAHDDSDFTGSTVGEIEIRHGATVLGSYRTEFHFNHQLQSGFFVIDQPGGAAEAMALYFRRASGTGTVRLRSAELVWLNLTELGASNYAYHEDDDSLSPVALSTTRADFAQVSAVGADGETWAVFGSVDIDSPSTSTRHLVNIRKDGTTVSPTDSQPESIREGEDVSDLYGVLLMRAFDLTAASTFAIQGRTSSGTGHDHYRSAILAIKLDAFEDFATTWTQAESSISNWGQLDGLTPTPTSTGTWLGFGQGVVDADNINEGGIVRLQESGTNVGSTGTHAFRGHDPADEYAYPVMGTFAATASIALDLDLDGRGLNSSMTVEIEDRSIIAFSLELADMGTSPPIVRGLETGVDYGVTAARLNGALVA